MFPELRSLGYLLKTRRCFSGAEWRSYRVAIDIVELKRPSGGITASRDIHHYIPRFYTPSRKSAVSVKNEEFNSVRVMSVAQMLPNAVARTASHGHEG